MMNSSSQVLKELLKRVILIICALVFCNDSKQLFKVGFHGPVV